MMPHERSLVTRYAGRPFAIVGVNSDPQRERIVRESARHGLTWRSFWDEAQDGPIASRWNVDGWPTLFLIDHEGVIRHKWVGSPGEAVLERAIEALVEQAEG